MCFAGIALVTDYDAGVLDGAGTEPVTHEQVLAVFTENLARVRSLIGRLVADLPAEQPPAAETAQTDAPPRLGLAASGHRSGAPTARSRRFANPRAPQAAPTVAPAIASSTTHVAAPVASGQASASRRGFPPTPTGERKPAMPTLSPLRRRVDAPSWHRSSLYRLAAPASRLLDRGGAPPRHHGHRCRPPIRPPAATHRDVRRVARCASGRRADPARGASQHRGGALGAASGRRRATRSRDRPRRRGRSPPQRSTRGRWSTENESPAAVAGSAAGWRPAWRR